MSTKTGPESEQLDLVPADVLEAGAQDTLLEVTSLRGEFWRRLRRNKLAVAGMVILAVIALTAIFADFIAFQKPGTAAVRLIESKKPPSLDAWFGTDLLGRDVFSMVVHGARFSMIIGFSVVAIALLVGLTVGGIAGFYGGKADAILSRLVDIFLAFPYLVGALIIVTALGGGRPALIAALASFGWVTIARLFRGSVISVRNAEYVEAARALGASKGRILLRHVFPNAVTPTLVYAFAIIGTTIIAEAALSFLGFGVSQLEASWGLMIATNRGQLLAGNWWMLLFPCLALTFTVMGFILLGDGLRDSLDPRLRS